MDARSEFEYRSARPTDYSLTLIIDDDPEAAAKAVKEAEGWRYYQSQHGKLPQSRSYESPYSIQEPPVSLPRYQAATSVLIARLPLASRLPLRARLRLLSEYKDELIPPPPRLRFKSKIGNIERRSGGVFITYNCNIVIRYLKDAPFTNALVSISL